MPTGLLNAVCDECHGGRLVFLQTGELQLEHQPGCPYKWREDTFLIELVQALNDKHTEDKPFTIARYPEGAKLNPLIHQMYHDGYMTKKRAEKVNKNFQLVRLALIKEGRWKGYLDEMAAIRLAS